MPVIKVDVYERSSGIAERLTALGADIQMVPLRAGDYVVGDGVLVERKQVLDLHESLVEGRLWSQMGRLRGACRWAYLLLEGADLERGPLSGSSVRGACLAVMEQRIRLIRAIDRDETAAWLYRLAMRSQQPRRTVDRPAYSQRPRKHEHAGEAVLAAVPGISTATARALLARFGSVRAVLDAGPDEWRDVQGVGEYRARQLHDTVSARWPHGQRAQDPST